MSYSDEWANCAGAMRVQNTDYVASDYVATLKRAISGDYNHWGNGEKVFSSVSIYDKYLRVPTKLSNTSVSNILYCYNDNVGISETLNNYRYATSPTFKDLGQVANTSKALDYMPRAHVVLRSVQELIDTYQSASKPLIWAWISKGLSIGTIAPRGWFYDKLDLSTFYNAMAGYYVIDSITFYTNKNDGTVQEVIGRISRTRDRVNFTVTYDNIIPLNVSVGDYKGIAYFGYYSHLVPEYLYSDQTIITSYIIRGGMTYGGLIKSAFITGAGDYVNNLASGYFYTGGNKRQFSSKPDNPLLDLQCATLDNWHLLLNAGGCAWSYDLDVVTSPDGNGLNEPTTPGQPENPVVAGDGTGDNISDKVLYPSPSYIPNATVYDRYFLTPNQMPDIKKFLFSDTFANNIKRLWTNPAEYVISLVCYPFDVDSTGLTTTSGVVSVGGVSSDIAAAALTDRGVPYFYGGSVMVDNYYNSYLDYEPYTSIDIYIPYIGVRPLNVSQVVGHTLCIGYYIDLNTQQITALIGLDGQGGNLGQVVTQFVGSIGIQTPLSGTSAQDMIRNIVAQTSGLITGVGAIAGGVMSANPALLASGVASTSNALLGGGHTAPSYYGSLSPVSGLYTPQVAYLIINRPRQAMPAAYLTQQGFSSNYSGKVSQFSGYLECASVSIASTNTMTEQEQQEIINLLTGGIYCG